MFRNYRDSYSGRPLRPARARMGIFRVSWGTPAIYSPDFVAHTDDSYTDGHGDNYTSGQQWQDTHQEV